ncbi:hypothetical protein X737_04925 [Mesorhizobium sp. L48C026A00]|nr:hypothetical protein X737_04925 [Mesorhizobium sp. L48C026A00]
MLAFLAKRSASMPATPACVVEEAGHADDDAPDGLTDF